MLPSRVSRPIVVDGDQYRWLVSDAAERLLVQRADGAGSRLEVPLQREIEGLYWLPLPGVRTPVPLTPRLVAQLVRRAKREGWVPGRDRSFRLG